MAPAKSASAFAAKNEDGLDRAAAWERAAQILDLSADLTRRLRTPELECVSRHEVRGSPASLYFAKMFSSCEGTLLRVELGAKCSASRAVSEARELEVQAALADCPWAAAAAGLQIATGTCNEQEVWNSHASVRQLSRSWPVLKSNCSPTTRCHRPSHAGPLRSGSIRAAGLGCLRSLLWSIAMGWRRGVRTSLFSYQS